MWESGIIAIDGELRLGGTIRIKTPDAGRRSLRVRVQQMPGEVVTWTSGPPLGLLTGLRTFTLSPEAGCTHLTVTEEVTGPVAALLRDNRPDTAESVSGYIHAARNRAELLDRVS